MSKIVAIQGYAASFHDVAARQLVGQDCIILPCDTFAEVFARVQNGQANFGVVATENSNYGIIDESQKLLATQPITILAEVHLRIEQCLLGLPGTRLDTINEIHSHPVALAQCSNYLLGNMSQSKLVDNADTAGSAADVQRWHDPTKAAIASQAAAMLHGLEVLVPGIENDPDNWTRFVSFC